MNRLFRLFGPNQSNSKRANSNLADSKAAAPEQAAGTGKNPEKVDEAKNGEPVKRDQNLELNSDPKTGKQYTLKTESGTPSALTLTPPAPNTSAPTTIIETSTPAKNNPVKSAPIRVEPVKGESGKSEPDKSEPGKNEAGNSVVEKVPATIAVPPQGILRPNNGPALIQLNNVVKAYQTPVGEFIALRGINLSIGHGEFVAVVGKSGSGKSTLINMITGIDRPTSGEIYVANTPIHTLAEGPMAEWRGRNLGIIFQFFQLLPMLSCIENVMLPMDFCNMYKPSEREERALHLLELVDMAEHAYKLPSEVSGGQQQRVAIARALANDPPVLVADEPTGNLDSRTAESVFQLFARMVDRGKTILMVTHDEEMAHQVRRTITIADGQIVQQEYHNREAEAPVAEAVS